MVEIREVLIRGKQANSLFFSFLKRLNTTRIGILGRRLSLLPDSRLSKQLTKSSATRNNG